jgi:hypothetical protein
MGHVCCMLLSPFPPVTCNPSRVATLPNFGVPHYIRHAAWDPHKEGVYLCDGAPEALGELVMSSRLVRFTRFPPASSPLPICLASPAEEEPPSPGGLRFLAPSCARGRRQDGVRRQARGAVRGRLMWCVMQGQWARALSW